MDKLAPKQVKVSRKKRTVLAIESENLPKIRTRSTFKTRSGNKGVNSVANSSSNSTFSKSRSKIKKQLKEPVLNDVNSLESNLCQIGHEIHGLEANSSSPTSSKGSPRNKKQRKAFVSKSVTILEDNLRLSETETETHRPIPIPDSPASSKSSTKAQKQRKVTVPNSVTILEDNLRSSETETETHRSIPIPDSPASSKSSTKGQKQRKVTVPKSVTILEDNLRSSETETETHRSPIPNSPASSKSSTKGKKQRKVTVPKSATALENNLCAIGTETQAPITIPNSPSSSKNSTRSKKQCNVTVSHNVTSLEDNNCSIETKNNLASIKDSSKSKKRDIIENKTKKKHQKTSVDEVKILQSDDNALGGKSHVLVSNANAEKDGTPKSTEAEKKVSTNGVINTLATNNELGVFKFSNLNPTVNIVQLPLIDYEKSYKVSEITMINTNTKENLANTSNESKTIGQSDLLKFKPKVRKRKFQGLLSDMVVQNLRKKIIKKQCTPVRTLNHSVYNSVTSTKKTEVIAQLPSSPSSMAFRSSQHSHLDNVHPSNQVNLGLDDSETISKILKHQHRSIVPFNIKINIDNRKQERTVEFSKPIDIPLAVSNKNINTSPECNISNSTSVTHTPLPGEHYNWSYNINEDNLLKITSYNKLFAHSLVTSSLEYENSIIAQNEKVKDDGVSSQSSYGSSAKSDFEFVKPCKRPPTRHKTSKSSNCGDSFNSVSDVSTISSTSCLNLPAVQDDVISIYSEWSIKTKDFSTTTFPSSRSTETNKAQVNSSSSEVIKKPGNDVPTEPNLHLPDTSYKNIAQWVENTQMYQNQQLNYIEQIPQPFKRLCYLKFTQGHCPRKYCSYAHTFNRDPYLDVLSLSQLRGAYEYIKDKPILFMAYITYFIKSFARHKCSTDLVLIVKDVMIPDNTKQIWNVKEIIWAMQQTGFTFESAIEKLMTFYKNDSFDILSILLTIVFENEDLLCSNWHLVQKLCQYRNYAPVDPFLVNRAMIFCCKTYNIDLAVKLVEDIFSRKLVNVQCLTQNHLTMFNLLFQNRNVKQADILSHVARLKSINFTSNDGFLHPTSNSCNYITPIGDLNQTTYDTNLNVNFNSNCSFQPITETNKYWTANVYEKLNNATTIYNQHSSNIAPEVTKDFRTEEVCNNQLNYEPTEPLCNREHSRVETILSDSEIRRLNTVISNNDHETLISMYNDYKNASNSNSFVLNVVGLFKKRDPVFTLNLVQRLINGIEKQNSQFQTAEATLFSLILNTVGILKQLKGYTEAAALLNMFIDCLENLTRVHWLRSVHTHLFTIVGKYLYFCQIFTKGKYYKSTLQILKSPELKLLHSSNKWDLPHEKTFDEEFRNKVLDEFITATLQNDLSIAKEIIVTIMMMAQEDTITEIDISRYFDKLILGMLNENQVNELAEMLPNIINIWYKHLKPANMRALLITFVKKRIPEQDLIMLYSKCCQRDIYPSLKGNETKICLTTDLNEEEIFITIRYFFYKMLKHNYKIQELLFTIKMPDQLNNKPTILIHSHWGITQTKERALLVLTKCFPSIIIVQSCGNDIKIKADQLKMCMESYRKSHSRCFWVRQSSVERMVPM